MEETMAARYWCHRCLQMVNPVVEAVVEADIKCPFCQSGFIEEMSSTAGDNQDPETEFGSDRALSLWAPILLGMMGNPRRRRTRRLDFEEEEEEEDNNDDNGESRHGGEADVERQLESIIRRRRRSSATILQLLQGIRAGMQSEMSENSEGDRDNRDRDRERERERDRVILINPFNQTVIVQGSFDSNRGQGENQSPIGSLGDYFIGPGLDLLLQHLAENDPNRYGTPPAQKEAIEALPTVTIKDNLQCSVCLDDFEMGAEAKQMPCKHKFHSGCILPWLELHSSCPVCMFQLPADETKRDSDDGSRNSTNTPRESSESGQVSGEEGEGEGDGRSGNTRRSSFWPFASLFSSSGPQSGGGNSSSTPSSSSANATGSGNASQTDEN